MNRTNLFTGSAYYGSTSDGKIAGSSREIVGMNQHILFMLKNIDGAEVALEYREAPEHASAFSPWTPLGLTTTCSEHITELLREGFVYRCNIITPAGQVELFVDQVADEAYEHHDQSENSHITHSKFGFNCGGADETGLI